MIVCGVIYGALLAASHAAQDVKCPNDLSDTPAAIFRADDGRFDWTIIKGAAHRPLPKCKSNDHECNFDYRSIIVAHDLVDAFEDGAKEIHGIDGLLDLLDRDNKVMERKVVK
jgi:hypothetical protein